MKKILLILGLGVNLCGQAQSIFESFDDGDFVTPPYTWSGNATDWNVVGTSIAGPNTTPSNTLKLNAAAAGPYYLSTPNSNWGTSQGWGFWMGREGFVINGNNSQYFWLYADRADLTDPAINGYRVALQNAAAGTREELILQKVEAGVVTPLIVSTETVANLNDYGFLVRVTRSSSNVWSLYTRFDISTMANGDGDFPFAVPFFVNRLLGTATDGAITIPPTGIGYLGVEAICQAPASRTAAEFDNILFDANGTLPVTLESFKATKDANKSRLDWKVGVEDNVLGYEIERSSTGVSFTKIGFVPATGSRSYSFTDGNILSGANFYRLKTVDIDGKYAYSFIVSINNRAGSFVKVFPNPASDRVYVQHTQAGAGAQIKVISMEGRLMQSTKIAENTAQTILDIQKLPAGLYNLIYDYGNGEQMVSKFVKK